jgi:hypothetical protein
MRPAPARIAVFVVISVGLIALAVALVPAGPAPAPPQTAAPPVAAPSSEPIAAASRRKGRLEQAATGFIESFLRYEVGDLPPAVACSLRRLSTASFGRYLLETRPRQHGPRGVARIVAVEAAFLDRRTDRALVRAAARRPDGPEELSFVFLLRGGRWLAARAAE